MNTFELKTTDETPYLYVTRNCSMDPDDVKKNMGTAYAEVMAFMQKNMIAPAGPALSVYYNYSPDELEFRAGFVIKSEDMPKAAGNVHADKTPSTTAFTCTHIGSYSELRNIYSEMMLQLETINKKVSAPTWELYVNDPDSTPEAELRTDIFIAVE